MGNKRVKKNNVQPKVIIKEKTKQYPIFCFRHIHSKYSFNELDKDETFLIVNKLCTLAISDWQTITFSSGKENWYETIAINKIRKQLPLPLEFSDITHISSIRRSSRGRIIWSTNDKWVFQIFFLDRLHELY